ncbi:MAG: hypothetical protein QG608_517 [Actinomycetota bacterium]|nr:hypothetical protein [Actinomycetota bacterium]
MGEVVYDKRDQLEKVESVLLPGETVHAVYDAVGAGTGFLGLTDLRILFQDNSFVGRRIALTSVPYGRINSVSFVSDKSIFGKLVATSIISVAVGGENHEVEFRGHEKARHAHDIILGRIVGA